MAVITTNTLVVSAPDIDVALETQGGRNGI